MKFIRVIKAMDVRDVSDTKDRQHLYYTIEIPSFWQDEEAEKQKIEEEKQTCKDVITSNFLQLYNSNKKEYHLEYSIFVRLYHYQNEQRLGDIYITKYNGSVYLYGTQNTRKQHRYLKKIEINSESDLASYISKYLDLIVDNAQNLARR